MDLRSTLNLPDPAFTIPMKADLPNLEPRIQAQWATEGIYHRIQESRKGAESFVLHDGPPYTNSPIHIGTAMNKILKDFVVKSRTMMGYRAPYVPGFDNHGLPIEQAVQRVFNEQKIRPTITELRKACREHASKYIGIQTQQFQRLGVFGLWEKPYVTMDYQFEAGIIRVFKELVAKGYVYKGLRPTLWSPTSQTALADTEIVYKDHISKAIYVRFPLLNDKNAVLADFDNVHTIIWTTTPWTIPSNLAVAFHPDFDYAIVRVTGPQGPEAPDGVAHYILAEALVPKVTEVMGWGAARVVGTIKGADLEYIEFRHPIFDRPSLGVLANYVTIEDGTGVVHTAPSHGRDDFFTGQRYGLPVPNTVDERGVLTQEAGEFAGTKYKDCDVVVVDRLREVGALLHVSDYAHSYPHAERDEKPVIFRATEQWFVGIDHDRLRDEMVQEIQPVDLETIVDAESGGEPKGVNWVPANGFNRISAMVSGRPDWCISRQRPWGVGIPIFYGAQSRVPVLDEVAIEAVAQLVEREGSDAWFERDPKDILPVAYRHPETGETEFVKETDVLDVWFDSGSTSLCVIDGWVYDEWAEKYPADLYLEGSDQHRGWFNSSLVIGTAIKGEAPYRQVVTHGFITAEGGVKMSKRLGNTVDPVEACDKFGADIIRYWVASVDFANDAPCSDNLLKAIGELYRSVRNTIRFLLGNLQGYDPRQGAAITVDLDQWAIDQVDLLCDDCVAAYQRYEYNSVITSIHNFCVKELSRFYLDAIKDRMYCDGTESPDRKSGQAACHTVLVRLLKLVAPILSHTAEETWRHMREVGVLPDATDSIHMATFDIPSRERLDAIVESELQTRYGSLRGTREDVFAAFEQWKGTDGVKDSQDAIVTIQATDSVLETLRSFEPGDLANLLKMSWVDVVEGEPHVSFRKSEFLKCERSRLRRPDVEEVNGVPLTKRDRAVLGL